MLDLSPNEALLYGMAGLSAALTGGEYDDTIKTMTIDAVSDLWVSVKALSNLIAGTDSWKKTGEPVTTLPYIFITLLLHRTVAGSITRKLPNELVISTLACTLCEYDEQHPGFLAEMAGLLERVQKDGVAALDAYADFRKNKDMV